MEFYNSNGYLDFRAVRDLPVPFVIVVGGRGTGKTYGALRSSVEDDIRFAFMRRTQVQLDLINKPDFSPMKRPARDAGWQITTAPIARGISGYYHFVIEDGRQRITGAPIGINVALATVANVRGYDASEIELLIYDEAIPERGERPIKNEWDRLANCYETMNRNRELEGSAPLKMVCLGNANLQTAPVLEGLRLVNTLDKMRSKGQTLHLDRGRGIALVVLRDSPISERKSDTALYRLTAGSRFAEMAIGNDFSYEDRGKIASMPLRELVPVIAAGGITVYRHKSRRLWYVSQHRSGAPDVYGTSEHELARFRRAAAHLYDAQLEDRVVYESYEAQAELDRYL